MPRRLPLAALAALAGACGEQPGAGSAPCPASGEVSYADHIRPNVFSLHCLRCHHSALEDDARVGSNPGVNLDTYEGATAELRMIPIPDRLMNEDKDGVLDTGFMPIDEQTSPTAAQLACVRKWIDQGAPP